MDMAWRHAASSAKQVWIWHLNVRCNNGAQEQREYNSEIPPDIFGVDIKSWVISLIVFFPPTMWVLSAAWTAWTGSNYCMQPLPHCWFEGRYNRFHVTVALPSPISQTCRCLGSIWQVCTALSIQKGWVPLIIQALYTLHVWSSVKCLPLIAYPKSLANHNWQLISTMLS